MKRRLWTIFLLTPLREGRLSESRSCLFLLDVFLLTPLREGRRFRVCHHRRRQNISTHAPAGGATWLRPFRSYPAILFLLTPLREGRRSLSPRVGRQALFLLTPLREGRRYRRNRDNGIRKISTHAPAGGATATTQETHLAEIISTHAPAGGATKSCPLAETRPCNFYSRPCGRGDKRNRSTKLQSEDNFYSRPCGRGDRCGKSRNRLADDFYSRPCGRGDQKAMKLLYAKFISTHAPAGGATNRGC